MTSSGRAGVFISEQLQPLTTSTAGVPGVAVPAFAGAFPRGPQTPVLISSWSAFTKQFGDFTTDPGNLLPFAVNAFFKNGGTSCYVVRVPNTDAAPASLILEDVNGAGADNVLTVDAIYEGLWGEAIYIEVTSAGQSGRVNLNVYFGATTPSAQVESYPSVSMNPADPRNLAAAVNSQSEFIRVTPTLPSGTYVAGANDLALIPPSPLTGGNDGSVSPDLGTAVPAAFDAMQGDQIINLNLPGVSNEGTLSAIASWAQANGNVVLVVDGPTPSANETSSGVATNYLNLVGGSSPLPASSYVSVYGPWLLVPDASQSIAGATLLIPPGGPVLGYWQVNDSTNGPQKAPAGVGASLAAVGLEVNFADGDLDALTNAQVNPIIFKPRYGYVIWGARTLHPGYPDRYLATRRALMVLEHDMDDLTQFAVFEPNDAALWSQITTVLTDYLTSQFQAGLLAGSSVSDAFAVVCDDTTNSASAAAAGSVTASVGVAIAGTAEWVNLQVTQITASSTSTSTS